MIETRGNLLSTKGMHGVINMVEWFGVGLKNLNGAKKILTSTYLFGIILAASSDAEVAQSVEQWTENPCVGSSILPLGILIHNPIIR